MKAKRPVNLDLTTIKFPPTAIASILHRISGVIIFILLPLLLWMLQVSLKSQESFDMLRDLLASPLLTLLVWGILAALIYHILAGIRHLLMDMHIGDTYKTSRKTAIAVIALSIIGFIVVGVLLW